MMDFPGRYIVINTSSPETLQTRLTDSGKHDEATIKAIIETIPSEDQAGELSNKVIINDDIEAAAKALSGFIYEKDGAQEGGPEDTEGTKDTEESKNDEEARGATEEMQVDAPATES